MNDHFLFQAINRQLLPILWLQLSSMNKSEGLQAY